MFREYGVVAATARRLTGIHLDEATHMPDLDKCARAYENWVASVTATVPKERLLMHTATDGFAPLCRFLGVPVPLGSYPRVNDTEDLLRQILVLGAIADYWYLTMFFANAAVFLTVYVCFCGGQKRHRKAD